jgi:DNA-binding beta-propeller fold protein YncE
MRTKRTLLLLMWMLVGISAGLLRADETATNVRHLLYVGVPGIRGDTQYGGAGILVFDIDHDHKFVRRIPLPALGDPKKPQPVKGICASADTGRLYVSTPTTLSCLDLVTDKVIWQKTYNAGCDRMAISPDGKQIYQPTFEGNYWHVIDANTGEQIAKVTTNSGSHNTVYGANGNECFCAGLRSPLLTVADTKNNTIEKTVGPFADSIRPFTVNGKQTLCYVCVNGLLGFEIGDITTGKKLYRVEVTGFKTGWTKRHGCPSHGVGLTPDEKEVWVVDGHNSCVHIFDNTVMPPKQEASIELHDQPGWITFSIDGRYGYPSTCDVIDTKTRKVLYGLKDENSGEVQSEKLLEIDFAGDKPVKAGNQFGVGRVTADTK